MLLGTLSVSLSWNLLTGKGAITPSQERKANMPGRSTIRAGECTVRTGQDFYPLTNFEIQKYYQNEPKYRGVHSRNNLPKIKHGEYVINLDEYKPIGTHRMASYVNANNIVYFDINGVEHIPKEIKKFIGNKINITNIHGIQSYDSIMCGYFCIGFIDFMLKGKSFLDYTNLFSPNDYEKTDKIMLKFFQYLKR